MLLAIFLAFVTNQTPKPCDVPIIRYKVALVFYVFLLREFLKLFFADSRDKRD